MAPKKKIKADNQAVEHNDQMELDSSADNVVNTNKKPKAVGTDIQAKQEVIDLINIEIVNQIVSRLMFDTLVELRKKPKDKPIGQFLEERHLQIQHMRSTLDSDKQKVIYECSQKLNYNYFFIVFVKGLFFDPYTFEFMGNFLSTCHKIYHIPDMEMTGGDAFAGRSFLTKKNKHIITNGKNSKKNK